MHALLRNLQIFLYVVSCSIIFLASPAFGQKIPTSYKSGSTSTTVTVSSSSAGTQVVSSINAMAIIYLASTATVPVWIFPTAGTCSSTLTTTKGIRLSRAASDKDPIGYSFDPLVEHWSGQICAILETGSTSTDLVVVTW